MEKRSSSPPAPMIGKIGRYTVFITPNPNTTTTQQQSPVVPAPPPPPPVQVSPVQVPPLQYNDSVSSSSSSSSDSFGFFWNALAKLQHAHSSLDEHLAHWFGLNQSKYQWALDDFYHSNPLEKEDTKANEVSAAKAKIQSV